MQNNQQTSKLSPAPPFDSPQSLQVFLLKRKNTWFVLCKVYIGSSLTTLIMSLIVNVCHTHILGLTAPMTICCIWNILSASQAENITFVYNLTPLHPVTWCQTAVATVQTLALRWLHEALYYHQQQLQCCEHNKINASLCLLQLFTFFYLLNSFLKIPLLLHNSEDKPSPSLLSTHVLYLLSWWKPTRLC